MSAEMTIRDPVPKAAGQRLINADACYYPPAVNPTDLLLVNFDTQAISKDGLYLLESVKDGAVIWRGCRRFEIHTGKLLVDVSGKGEWDQIDLASSAWRVVGKVDQVFRPSI